MLTQAKKDARIARAKAHAAADRLMSGTYVDDNDRSKGCSVGCDAIDIAGWQAAARGGCHAIVAAHDGTPEWLERLRDTIFEGLPADRRSWWHVSLAEALPVNRGWRPYYHLVSIVILDELLRHRDTWPEDLRAAVVAAIEGIRTLHAARSAAESAAWSAARSAAESAAWSARSARSAAKSAAWSAAESAESAAWSAAWSAAGSARSAAESAAWSAAGSAAYVRMAETIIATLRA